ncbi:MAG: bile acid:sodium symporter family protein, partial [Calditrichaeota bacterium]
TMTACSTLASPVVTPFYMKVLAGKLVPIHFLSMMLSILNMIVVPIVVGLIANRVLYGHKKVYQNPAALIAVMLISLAGAAITLLIPLSAFGVWGTLRSGLTVGLVLLCATVLAKLIINIRLKKVSNWMDRVLPLVSMAGICLIIAIITARSADQLKTIGFAIILAAMLHNLTGYLLGFWLARAAKLDERDSRTVAIEVGLQNGGMASGLAMTVLNSAKAALAPAIFGPWMNISGSILANYWQRKKPRPQQ